MSENKNESNEPILYDINTYTRWNSETELTKVIAHFNVLRSQESIFASQLARS